MTTYAPVYGGAATLPPRKTKLAGRDVSPAMLNDAYAAKKAGRRVVLVTAGSLSKVRGAAGDCENCEGYGQLGLEVLMAGPFQEYPGKGRGPAGENGDTLLVAVVHNGGWYTAARTMYPCPVCSKTVEIQL